MIWVAGRSPTLVSQNLKATTLTYLAIKNKNSPEPRTGAIPLRPLFYSHLGLLYLLPPLADCFAKMPTATENQDGGYDLFLEVPLSNHSTRHGNP